MCGIAGILYPNSSGSWLESNVIAMSNAIRHRGPDGNGFWVDSAQGVGFSHTRLSIIDLTSSGSQPMTSATGRFILSYNGEIYNFPELKQDLIKLGIKFKGTSDTEVLLASIEMWGLQVAISRCIGMFAFALWDRSKNKLSLVRDRLGVKPLYWGLFNSLFIFGSELHALKSCAGWDQEIDRNSLSAYSRWNYIPSPHSIFKGVYKLEPGSILTIAPNSQPVIKKYWNLRSIINSQDIVDINDSEAINQFESILSESVRSRLISDVPLGAFLSGGIDSSLITTLMQKESINPIQTFTIGFHDNRYNEANNAKLISGHLSTNHTELYVGPEEALEIIPSLSDIYDEPFADSSQLPTSIVSSLTRKYVTVALSGDGGDELFAGYTRYYWANLINNKFYKIPLSIRKMLARSIELPSNKFWESLFQFVPSTKNMPRVGERIGKFANFLREPNANALYRNQHSHWLNPENMILNSTEPRGIPFDDDLTSEIPNFITRMQFIDSVTYLPDDILTKLDRASMAVGLEARVPMLDHRVVEYSWKIPQRMKFRDGISKWLPRQVLYKYLPKSYVDHPKKGFSIPLSDWLRGPLKDWANSYLSIDHLKQDGYWNYQEVNSSWENFLKGDSINQESIWGVLMFESWIEKNKNNNK